MTDTELAQKIVDQKGSCSGVGCDRCPIKKGCNDLLERGKANIDFRKPDQGYVELAESYLLEKKYLDEH